MLLPHSVICGDELIYVFAIAENVVKPPWSPTPANTVLLPFVCPEARWSEKS
jgi:hypothetical protein